MRWTRIAKDRGVGKEDLKTLAAALYKYTHCILGLGNGTRREKNTDGFCNMEAEEGTGEQGKDVEMKEEERVEIHDLPANQEAGLEEEGKNEEKMQVDSSENPPLESEKDVAMTDPEDSSNQIQAPDSPTEAVKSSVLAQEPGPKVPIEEVKSSMLVNEPDQAVPIEVVKSSVLAQEPDQAVPIEVVKSSVLAQEPDQAVPIEAVKSSVLVNEPDQAVPTEAVKSSVLAQEPEPMVPIEEVKSSVPFLEELKSEEQVSIHRPSSEGFTCVVDRHISENGKKVPIEPLQAAITQLRTEGKSWTDILAAVFGYRYDEDWRLRKIGKDEGFTFIEQKHYELLGDVILSYIQEVLKVKYHLQELWIPEEGPEGRQCNIFISPDFEQNTERCLLLIQGAGAVRAGQWARSVCINSKLTEGTVFPALDFAQSHGFSTIIFNPNMNYVNRQPIPGNNSMEAHSKFVWKKYIRKCQAQALFIIAHSCGGMCTTTLLEEFENDFVERVRAVAFTDSVHGAVRGSSQAKRHLASVSVDFVASRLSLKTLVSPLSRSYNSCVCVSSGHEKHEYTTGSAMPAIVEFFEEMLRTGRNLFLSSSL